jgi:hypothetical protein
VKRAFPFIVLAITFATTAVARVREPSLVGLRRVGVSVSISGRLRSATGLTADAVRAHVVDQLRRGRIGLLSPELLEKEQGRPQLFVELTDIDLSPVAPNAPDFVITTTLSLYQDVTLKRQGVGNVQAVTWSTAPLLTVCKLRSGPWIRSALLENVDRLSSSFLETHKSSHAGR